jgi:glycerone phosphate O-acyltransferase
MIKTSLIQFSFKGLSFLSEVIRRTGAFFIRRSFGSDQLYWAIFNEYVQSHLLNCDRPLEFFIEGTRSRTSKSLPPKFGMLATCLELYLKNHRIDDIYLIPISLTYEKLLEETLYASELLGIPKPKESVSGLVKARSILSECYGSIFINFAKPISVREMMYHLNGGYSMHLNVSLTPSFIFELNSAQMKTIETVSYSVLIEMLRNQIIQPISLIATCLLLTLTKNRKNKYLISFHINKFICL